MALCVSLNELGCQFASLGPLPRPTPLQASRVIGWNADHWAQRLAAGVLFGWTLVHWWLKFQEKFHLHVFVFYCYNWICFHASGVRITFIVFLLVRNSLGQSFACFLTFFIQISSSYSFTLPLTPLPHSAPDFVYLFQYFQFLFRLFGKSPFCLKIMCFSSSFFPFPFPYKAYNTFSWSIFPSVGRSS